MRVMEFKEFGIDNLTEVEQEKPKPGPGQVLIKFGAASINFRDIMIASNKFGPGIELPLIPLSDGAGTVEGVGADATRFKEGDRVSPMFFSKWIDGVATFPGRSLSMGKEVPGPLREYGVYDEDAVSKFADHLSDEEAACFPCAGVTAWRAIVTLSNIQKGDIVLCIGTGGVSLFALQFAKALGAEVAIVSSSDEKLEKAKELGADYVVNYKTTPKWGAEINSLTKGGVNAVVETAGAGTIGQSLDALALGGHIASIGAFTGAEANVSLGIVMFKNANIHGMTVGNRADYEAMMACVEEHKIKPVIHESYGFENAVDALNALPKGDHFGKITIKI